MLETILLQLKEYWKELLYVFIMVVCIFFPRADKKYIKELENFMKFKTNSNIFGVVVKGQEFSSKNMKPIYRVNKTTNELEATGEYIDMDELIQSARDTCLQAVLEKFETLRKSVDTVSDDVEIYDGYRDKMDDLTVLIDRANEYREQFGLDDSTSLQDIYSFVDKKAVELKASIEERKKIIKEKENEKKKNEQES